MYRKLKFWLRLIARPFIRKFAFNLRGKAPVSSSCQIPSIREIYGSLQFEPTNGLFVEVGGFDGETYSNTSFLADQGWRGVYIEPVPTYAAKIRWRHILNKVQVFQVGIAEREGEALLNVAGPLSSLNDNTESVAEAIGQANVHIKRISINCKTISSVLSDANVPYEFDLLVIDIEGGERAVLDNIFESRWRPKVIIIELCDNHPSFSEFPELQSEARLNRSEISRNGYRQVFTDEINTVFVRMADGKG